MIEPAHLAHFWRPVGATTPLANITIEAVLVEVTDPSAIVFSEPGVEGRMTATVTFADLGDGRTEVVTHETNRPEMSLAPEALAGTRTSFDKFARSLRTL